MKSKRKSKVTFDDHEGLSLNQADYILYQCGLDRKPFLHWMGGQTCPVIPRRDHKTGQIVEKFGIYEYDLFRYIRHKKFGTDLVFD